MVSISIKFNNRTQCTKEALEEAFRIIKDSADDWDEGTVIGGGVVTLNGEAIGVVSVDLENGESDTPAWPSLKQRVVKAEARVRELETMLDILRDDRDLYKRQLAECEQLLQSIETKIEALKHDKTTAFAVERDMYMREAEKWKAIYLKAVEGTARDDRWEQAAAAFETQHRIIVGILTDSQLDTRGSCGKFLREYKTAYQILTESGVLDSESQED